MAETILLVFEGSKREPQILDSFRKNYLHGESRTLFHVCYEAEVYQLWQSLKDDPDVSLIRELQFREQKLGKPSGIPYEKVTDIFLFFDYDGQSSLASDRDMADMLRYFQDSNTMTGNGLLYLSYPMVEAIRHLAPGIDFSQVVVNAKITGAEYKKLSACSDYQHLKKLEKADWDFINAEHYKKAHFIVCGSWALPANQATLATLNQSGIFAAQLKKYIQSRQEIAVLSAFPFFIVEYFGEKVFAELQQSLHPSEHSEP